MYTQLKFEHWLIQIEFSWKTGDENTMSERKMTMEERIKAFYQQSGGPHNSQIPKLLEKHLLYGKDHGMAGYKETFEDAIIDTLVMDPSLLLLFERVQRWRMSRKENQGSLSQLEGRIKKLEEEVYKLREEILSRV
jgi:hypothetical protein